MILTHPSLTRRVTKSQCHRQKRNFKTDASGSHLQIAKQQFNTVPIWQIGCDAFHGSRE